METPEGLPPLPAAEPAAVHARQEPEDDPLLESDDDEDEPDAPAELPSLETLGFMPNLLLFLAAPMRAFSRVDDVPVRTGVRFGFLAAFAGIMGTSLKTWVRGIPESYPPVETFGTNLPVACMTEQLTAWDHAVHPWLLARIPVSPVLALLLVYGLGHLFHLMASAMVDRLDVDMPTLTRNIGFACAPLTLGAIFPFGMCFTWSLCLCVFALQRALKFPWWLCISMATVPFWGWMATEFLINARMVAPCLQGLTS